jgi:antitoxin YefM
MRRTRLDRDIVPLSEFRSTAASCIDRVKETRRAIVLTQRGHSTAVLVDVREYERLLEELELLRDIAVADRQFSEGLAVDHEDARGRVLSRISRER